jgi:hypothetical protein
MGFKKTIRLILLSIIICIWSASCNYDIIESKFTNYKQAMDENYFDKGWIPKELANKEMKKIYIKNDLDRNTCIFSYHLPSAELEKLEENLIRLEQNYTERMNINNSIWFEKDLLNLPKYRANEFKHGIAINKEKRIVYGWLN